MSPIGRDDLIWLHILGETCSVAANVCSSPLGGAPEASAFSAYAWKSAKALCLLVMVVLATSCAQCNEFRQHCRRGLTAE